MESATAANSGYAKEHAWLSPEHERLIVNSGIDPAVARERGYRTETVKAHVRRLGFGASQALTPAFLVPLFNVRGECVSYQLRPDQPRTRDGKVLKYENPAGSRLMLDCHPRLTKPRIGLDATYERRELPPLIADPTAPLVITEGTRKADAGVTIGLCCVSVMGVFGFRGRNEAGGLVALPDWENVALKGRLLLLAWDSDVVQKIGVYRALARLKLFLERRGAIIRVIYFSCGAHGEKVGLDDAIVACKRRAWSNEQIIDGLLKLASDELRPPPDLLEPDADAAVKYPFRLTESSVEYAEEGAEGEINWRFICSRLEIVATSRNEADEDWGRLLAFKDDDGREHYWPMPMELLAGEGAACRERLLSMGLHIGSGQKPRNRPHEYIQTTTPPACSTRWSTPRRRTTSPAATRCSTSCAPSPARIPMTRRCAQYFTRSEESRCPINYVLQTEQCGPPCKRHGIGSAAEVRFMGSANRWSMIRAANGTDWATR